MSTKVKFHSISFGADPEMFFRKNNGVVGAEKVLPEEGFVVDVKSRGFDSPSVVGSSSPKIIIDGVQAELNPRPHTDRAEFAREIGFILKELNDKLLKSNGISIDFAQAVELTDEEMAEISDKFKKFGCSPSKNVYVEGGISKITVNPLVYKGRSAGGHLHIGLPPFGDIETSWALKHPNRLVPMLDLIVGNTAVLIDRDSSNKRRRQVYGKAGEHRTPIYGVEYRTPSNFWLKNHQLLCMVTGLARMAVIVTANSKDDDSFEKALFSKVRMRDVVNAINDNDYELALHNFKQIEEVLLEMFPANDEYPIHKGLSSEFTHFFKKGVEHWFKGDPMEQWEQVISAQEISFEKFLRQVVRADMIKS